jgi:hypothetical protein
MNSAKNDLERSYNNTFEKPEIRKNFTAAGKFGG